MENKISDSQNLPYLRVKGNNIFIDLYVKPNTTDDYMFFDDNEFIVHSTAPPVKGGANKQILQEFSKLFNVKQSNIEIVAGVKSFSKKLRITCKDAEETNNVLKILIENKNKKIQ